MPVTANELFLDPLRPIVTKTDLKGRITYANPAFVEISGFTLDELIGQPHNVVRHPDMPKQAFADLWNHIRDGKSCMGPVKNRCKNGDYYWVDAYVMPISEKGKVIGYESVRCVPNEQDVARAEQLYQQINSTKSKLSLPQPTVLISMITVLAALISLVFAGLGAAQWVLIAGLLALVAGVGGEFAKARGPVQWCGGCRHRLLPACAG